MNLNFLTAVSQTRPLPEGSGVKMHKEAEFSEFFQIIMGDLSDLDDGNSDGSKLEVVETEIEAPSDSLEAEFDEIQLEAGVSKAEWQQPDVPAFPEKAHSTQLVSDSVNTESLASQNDLEPIEVADFLELSDTVGQSQTAPAVAPLTDIAPTRFEKMHYPVEAPTEAPSSDFRERTDAVSIAEKPPSSRPVDGLNVSLGRTSLAIESVLQRTVGESSLEAFSKKADFEAAPEKKLGVPRSVNFQGTDGLINARAKMDSPLMGGATEAVNTSEISSNFSEGVGAFDGVSLSAETAEPVQRSSIAEALSTESSVGPTSSVFRSEVRIPEPVLIRVPETSAEQKLFVSEVADHLGARIVQHPEGVVELELEPADLGRLKMSFRREDGITTVVVEVDKRETMDLMRRHAEQFMSELKSDTQGDVRLKFEMSGHAQNQGRGQGQPHSRPEFDATSLDDNQNDPAPSRRVLSSGSRMDIRV